MPIYRISEPIARLLFNIGGVDVDFQQGQMYWDDASNTIAINIESNGETVTLQVGQEQQAFVRNILGAPVPNASAIFASGSTGNKITFTLSKADNIITSLVHGLSTQTIQNNDNGVATTFGIINDVDTQTPGWNEGDILYLSETTAGSVKNTAPTSGFTVAVGIVLRRHLTQGQIMIKPWVRPAFGDVYGGNYTQFEYDGTMRFLGNATTYRDELQSLTGARLQSPASDVVDNIPEAAVTFQTSARYPTDYVTTNHQINHDWELGSDIYPHLHWWQVSANIPNWLIEYRWQKQGSAKTTVWSPLAWSSNAFTWTAGTLNQITGFGAITPPVGYGQVSDIVQFRVYRDVTNVSTLFVGADPEAADIDAVNFDTHVESDTHGSRQQYVK